MASPAAAAAAATAAAAAAGLQGVFTTRPPTQTHTHHCFVLCYDYVVAVCVVGSPRLAQFEVK